MTNLTETVSPLGQTARQSPSVLTATVHALVACALVMLLSVQSYNPDGIPNSDDLLRMVQVRDLLAGQNWFDLVQHRLGTDGGTLMHWSRLVDGPIAVIYRLAELFTGSAGSAEAAVKLVWPSTLLFAALFAFAICAVRIERDDFMLPAVLIGAVALYSTGVFAYGTLDHHNVQIALAVWMISLLIPGSRPALAHFGAGMAAGLMLGVGMEGLPYVTLAGFWVAGTFAIGASSRQSAMAFGLSLALVSLVIFLGTVPPARWTDAACDAFSSFHLVMAVLGGTGLAATALLARSQTTRLAGLAATAGLAGFALIALFPHCLANPLASLDPLIQKFWLDGVMETRSVADLFSTDPFTLIGTFGLMLSGLIVSLFGVLRTQGHMRTSALLFAVLLFAAIAVTCWQQRAYVFGTAFAVFPMACLVMELRVRQNVHPTTGRTLTMIAGWIAAINLTWWIAGAQMASAFASAPTLGEQIATAKASDYCYGADVYEALSREPKGVVLGATDIGASVLTYTDHRAIAGPYHRNTAGIGLLIHTMIAKPAAAKTLIEDAGITIVADCENSADAQDFRKAAPEGLQAALHRGEIPDWLTPVAETLDEPLVLYRVTPHAAWAIRE